MRIVDGVEVRTGHARPARAQERHAPLHLAQHPLGFFAQPRRAGIARVGEERRTDFTRYLIGTGCRLQWGNYIVL